jgi:hypothetical protein
VDWRLNKSSSAVWMAALGRSGGTINQASAMSQRVCLVAGRAGSHRQTTVMSSAIGIAETALCQSQSVAGATQDSMIDAS